MLVHLGDINFEVIDISIRTFIYKLNNGNVVILKRILVPKLTKLLTYFSLSKKWPIMEEICTMAD